MDLAGKKVAVTGASGFLGSHIVERLLARGAVPIGVVRNPKKAQWLADKGVELRTADLGDPAALQAAFTGVDAVISCAALYTLGRVTWAQLRAANEDGTKNVMEATAKAGCKRVVVVSTCGVYRPVLWGLIREDTWKWTLRDSYWFPWAYPVSKALAEQVAWDKAKELDLQLTAVRPAGILGPRDPENAPAFKRVMRLPLLIVPGLIFPFSHAADIADGCIGAIANDASIGKAYNLSGDAIPITQFVKAWKAAAGGGPRLISIPLPRIGMIYANDAAKQDLGFTNRPVEQIMADAVASVG